MKTWLKKVLSYRFTFMVVPHGGIRPRQINIPVALIVTFFVMWTAVTFWGSYLSAQHIDYWRTEATNQVLKLKVKYLMTQLDRSRQYMDEVKTVDGQLRQLLEYKSQKAIIREDIPVKATVEGGGTGGPTAQDAADLRALLSASDSEITWERMIEKVGLVRNEARTRLDSYQDLSGWIQTQRKIFRCTPRGWPARGPLTSHFGMRVSPFDAKTMEYHAGLDISAPIGAPVRATADGVVRVASWNSGYGNLVMLQHEFGFSTRYGHNSKILVRVGDRVKRGQVVALIGETGRANGPHCHYEVWRNNERKNPIAFLKDDDGTVVARKTAGKEPSPDLN